MNAELEKRLKRWRVIADSEDSSIGNHMECAAACSEAVDIVEGYDAILHSVHDLIISARESLGIGLEVQADRALRMAQAQAETILVPEQEEDPDELLVDLDGLGDDSELDDAPPGDPADLDVVDGDRPVRLVNGVRRADTSVDRRAPHSTYCGDCVLYPECGKAFAIHPRDRGCEFDPPQYLKRIETPSMTQERLDEAFESDLGQLAPWKADVPEGLPRAERRRMYFNWMNLPVEAADAG